MIQCLNLIQNIQKHNNKITTKTTELYSLYNKINQIEESADVDVDVDVEETEEPHESLNYDFTYLKDSINDCIHQNTVLIKDINKKIKQLDNTIEKLYINRKPCNIVIPTSLSSLSITPLEYLSSLKTKHLEQYTINTNKIDTLHTQIEFLHSKDLVIENNNNKILELQKQMVRLPDNILELIDDNSNDLENKYKVATLEWVNTLKPPHTIKSIFSKLSRDSEQYHNYEDKAHKHFISKTLLLYKNKSELEDNILIEQQSQLEDENHALKTSMKNIRQFEIDIKQIEGQQLSISIQIKHIDNDISNLETNKLLDDDITLHKRKRVKYEKKIETYEITIIELTNQLKSIDKYDILKMEFSRLSNQLVDIDNLLTTFKKYSYHIKNNITIQNTIDALQNELAEFEISIEEVEKSYNISNEMFMKSSALLEQIKLDLAKNREIDETIIIFDVYRKSLKALPYILLSKIKPMLEKNVNDLLTIISDFTLKFDMSDNKIDIYIDRSVYKLDLNNKVSKTITSSYMKSDKHDGKPVRHILVNNASGFERFISSLAIRIALLDMSSLPKISCMAIDEGWSSFDNTNLNNVSIILDFLRQKFDFILTISHIPEIKQHCDVIISLRQDEHGISKIIL